MERTSGAIAVAASVMFTLGLVGGCAPTVPGEEVVTSEDALVICGNGACEAGETCASCPGDCGRCTQSHCGDGTCGRRESCATCAADCGACPGCGNGVCDDTESCSSCAKDCGKCGGEFCGNGVCGRRESCTACARDCCPGSTGGGGGSGGCASASECPATMNECLVATCTNGVCGTSPVSAGTPTTSQTAGDCQQVQCDGMGGTQSVMLDTDLPADDGNACTIEGCSDGIPMTDWAAQGAPCTGGTCDGMGTCVPISPACMSDFDCPLSMNGCIQNRCVAGTCTQVVTPSGLPSQQQTSGDCSVVLCDGMGGSYSQVEDTDVPSDGNECTYESCQMGVPLSSFAPFGTPCMQNGGVTCDGMGTCVGPM